MATLVEKGDVSGINLSELTSGELMLINLIFNPVIINSNNNDSISYCLIGYNNIDYSTRGGGKNSRYCTLDFSKISSITFRYYVKRFDSGNLGSTRCSFICFNSSGDQIGSPFWSSENAQTIYFSNYSSFDSTKKCAIALNLDYNVQNHAIKFEIISFTTTDGKVHTADNLNY